MIFHSKYRRITKGNTTKSIVGILSFFFLFLTLDAQSQSKEELQKERDRINEQIAYTSKLIANAKKNRKSTENQLLVLDQQISLRRSLIRHMDDEIQDIQENIEDQNLEILRLENEVESLKEEYGKMIFQAHKNRSGYDQLMFVFASNDFNQAFKRMKILQQYAAARKSQTKAIENTQTELTDAIQALEQVKNEKQALRSEKSNEFNKLESDVGSRKEALTSLKVEEKKLLKQREQQEQERQRLNRAIRKIIEEELAASKAKNDGKFTLTPEGKIVSQNFEKNKGKLPWPVTHGVVTGTFGKQAHPFLPGITIENKGIDINTDENAEVRSVFGGIVSKVFSIMGAGMNIIVTHGAYKSVYTNLQNVSVKPGDKVEARETLGTCISEGNKTIAHIEIWKVSDSGGAALNPSLWLTPK